MSIERGTLLYRTGRHELAEQEFRAALAADPADALAHAMLGHCLLQRQQFDEAAAEAQQAIQLRPDWDAGYATVAAVFNGRHRLPEAAIAIERAIGLAPFNPDHRALLANVRFQQRRWADALAAADAGLAIDPRHPGCVNARAMALVSLGRRDEATATLGGQLARDPHSAVTQANQGWALLHAGDHRAALEHFREALRINPELQWAKSGIVEALKARNVIYRVMLRYFLFMSRMSRQVQWGIILGGYFGYQALATASRDSPGVRPYVVPVMVAYVGFALLTWLAAPAFNLMLRLDRFGRYVLSRDQRLASNGFALCLLTAIGLVIAGVVRHDPRHLISALVPGLLSMPVTSTFRMAVGWPRGAMGAATAALALIGGGFVASLFVDRVTASATSTVGYTFIYGTLGANLLANALAGARVRR